MPRAARREAVPPARRRVQQVWPVSVIELRGERFPALSTACTLYVFDDCVP
jgi:hypothetical protein